MAGIKLPRIRLAGTQLNLLSLALLAVSFGHPALAEDLHPSIQTLEWSGDSVSGAGEAAAEASRDDVSQRIRGGFRIDDTAAQNPLV